jgi:hypothetical protein
MNSSRNISSAKSDVSGAFALIYLVATRSTVFHFSLKASIQTLLIPIFIQQATLLMPSETRVGLRTKYMLPFFNFD